MSHPRNAHVMMVAIYSLFPLMFGDLSLHVEEKNPESDPSFSEPISEEELGLGGPRWILLEEEEEQGEEVDEYHLALFGDDPDIAMKQHTRVWYTGGEYEAAEIRRINWFKVAETSLPVTRNIISSDFGWRTAPCSGCSSDHQGVDFVPGEGTAVMAAMDGVVIDKGFNDGYGEYIILEHVVPVEGEETQRWETVYAHLQKDSVPVEIQLGSLVERKEVIGRVGNTGMSTGPHLHFEIRINGESVDPLPLLGNYQVLRVSIPADEEIPEDLVVREGYLYRVVYEQIEVEKKKPPEMEDRGVSFIE